MMRNPGFGLDSFYAKGAKGCIVELYQFRCTDECKVGCYPILQIPRIFNVFYILIYS